MSGKDWIPGTVRQLRGEMTLKELAEKSGLSLSYISDIERGRTDPSIKTLDRIFTACGKTLALDYVNSDVAQNATSTDCRTPDGVTVGLIDSLIVICRVLHGRKFSSPAVQEALKDLSADSDFKAIQRVADKARLDAITPEEWVQRRLDNYIDEECS